MFFAVAKIEMIVKTQRIGLALDMRKVNLDSFPHMLSCLTRMIGRRWWMLRAMLTAYWWGVQLGRGCLFVGRPRFKRHPGSHIEIGRNCKFNSSSTSNWIGVNRPCMISTLKKSAELQIGDGCGFSGTVVGCGIKITLGNNVRCGANTLITDTDWHTDDPRSQPDKPVHIEDDVWLGVNVVVLKGVTIGKGTMVGANSLVTRSLPSGVMAAGIPAKILRKI